MNVSPTQRLVNYLREFPPVRPQDRAAEPPRAAEPAEAAARARAAEAARRPAPPRPAPAQPPQAEGAVRRMLPRGTLVNIVT